MFLCEMNVHSYRVEYDKNKPIHHRSARKQDDVGLEMNSLLFCLIRYDWVIWKQWPIFTYVEP